MMRPDERERFERDALVFLAAQRTVRQECAAGAWRCLNASRRAMRERPDHPGLAACWRQSAATWVRKGGEYPRRTRAELLMAARETLAEIMGGHPTC